MNLQLIDHVILMCLLKIIHKLTEQCAHLPPTTHDSAATMGDTRALRHGSLIGEPLPGLEAL